MTTPQLKRSHDRKVANLVTKNGKQAAIANTFGLPAGKAYSCPGATSVCESVCYAGKLEKLFKGVRANLLHNWELLKDANPPEWKHARPFLGKEIPYFHFMKTKRWPL